MRQVRAGQARKLVWRGILLALGCGLLILGAALAPGGLARAQVAVVQQTVLGSALDEIKAQAGRAERLVEQIEKEAARLRLQIDRPDVEEQALRELRQQLDQYALQLLAARKELDDPLTYVERQLEALGPPPGEGVAEDEEIAAQRQQLQDVKRRLEAAANKLDLLRVEIQHLSSRAVERLRAQFFSDIFQPSRSVLNPLLWLDGLATLPDFTERLRVLVSGWVSGETRNVGALLSAGLLLVAMLVLAQIWRRWRGPLEERQKLVDDARRLWRAVQVPLLTALLTFGLLVLMQLVLYTFGAPSPRAERLLAALAQGVMYAAVLTALARGILRPRNAHMRLVDISDAGALKAYRLAALLALLHGLDHILVELGDILFLPVEFTVVWSAGMSIAHVVLAYLFIITLRRSPTLSGASEGLAPESFLFGWARYAFHLMLALLLVIILALLFGYVALAHFIARQMVFTTALVAALYLLHHLADALVKSAFDTRTAVGRYLRQDLLLPERTIARASVLFSTLVDILTVLVGLPLILMQWAVNWADFMAWARRIFFGFKVGNITIEPASILAGLVVLVIGLALVRLLVQWLDRRVLARSDLDTGVRHSILAVARYSAIVGAFLVALSVAGVNLTSLAFFGGALGIGIGFGLQTIVNNFVSGLILLAERPIKAGDWIKVSGGEGVVRRIKVRSTEIETFDRCTIIVPNSQLIAEPVSNWFHETRMGRVRIPVGVSYDADPDEVSRILLECARAHPRALANPAPFVLFIGFGDSSLDFELRVYIDDAGYMASTASDLRFAIFRKLKEAGIEIPFPQRDLHVRSLPAEAFDRQERSS